MSCHGGVAQQGGLSFLFEKDLYQQLKSGKIAVVPGNAQKSELFQRITSDNPRKVMPPEGPPLSEGEQKLLQEWINQGAIWETHWAYVPLEENGIPSVTSEWVLNNIDPFILTKAGQKGLMPNPIASPEKLMRRLHLDIIGFQPTPEELSGYFSDPSQGEYEKVVDRLLTSPHFGEKWATFWLDLARYADSQGFQKDHIRPTMWMYRDWVIHAFNQDMPFDSFTIKQLAGDLLPSPSEQDFLATAFHRNTMTNDEGGTDDEEYRVRAVIDRVNTTMEVWQASTFGCVQCHSHPYDPIVNSEYYSLKGYFNNTADRDLTSDFPRKNLLSTGQREKLIQYQKMLKLPKGHLTKVKIESIKNFIKTCQPQPVPILQELPDTNKRKNPLFVRGNWLLQEGDLEPGVPNAYNQSLESYNKDRLGLAQWLVDSKNPLTARVIVNRIWHQIFGRGIVETVEDFGIQGATPSHPELLDYLAYRLIYSHKWHLKPLIKDMVTSATYQQSTIIRDDHLDIDPDNQLLMRASRDRLSAEQIRDQALCASGLLNRELYGPSVMPHQPEGVWNVIRQVARWKTSPGDQKYRRGLYTFYRRVSPYPTMLTFDAPSRELCVSRRTPTNTPLQALTTLNDPVFVEAAEEMAKNARINHSTRLKEAITEMYSKMFLVPPTPEVYSTLELLYQGIANGSDTNPDDELQLEGLTAIATTLLNLDATLVKS